MQELTTEKPLMYILINLAIRNHFLLLHVHKERTLLDSEVKFEKMVRDR